MKLTDKELADLIDCVSEILAGEFDGSTWEVNGDGGQAAVERLSALHGKLCTERDSRKNKRSTKHQPPA